MTVTDEMIEAMRVVCSDAFGNPLLTPEGARAALTAALKVAPVGVGDREQAARLEELARLAEHRPPALIAASANRCREIAAWLRSLA